MDSILFAEERFVLELRELYANFGYLPYRMSEFEEYELYVHNRNFVDSVNIVTFPDSRGNLLALRPDVTLSIAKNAELPAREDVFKCYYNENVYRPFAFGEDMCERAQAGLECIGDIDDYLLAEVIMLAERSLCMISETCSLDISHIGLLEAAIELGNAACDVNERLLVLIERKNAAGIRALCTKTGLSAEFTDRLVALTELYGPVNATLSELGQLVSGEKMARAYDELQSVFKAVECLGYGEKLRLDLSIVNDLNYYSGIIFQGYADGVPTHVLSGGAYDNLMAKLGKPYGAVGFAVYVDLLERYGKDYRKPYSSVRVLYGLRAQACDIASAVKRCAGEGLPVIAQRSGRDDNEITVTGLVGGEEH